MRLNKFTGLDITLQMNGRSMESPEGTAYVEVASGNTFSINVIARPGLRRRHARDEIAVYVKLDGKDATGIVISPPGHSTITGVDANEGGRSFKRKFLFSDLTTIDTTEGLKDPKAVERFKPLGSVEVTCVWVRRGSTFTKPESTQPEAAFQPQLAEKALKGRSISSRTSYADPEPLATPVQQVNVTYPYLFVPFATFCFKYRSKDDLQKENIIPRSPSPVPLEDRDPDSLNLLELRELARRAKDTRELEQKIKQEGQAKEARKTHEAAADDIDGDDEENDADEGNITITSEGNRRKRQRIDSAAEVVDLTDD